MPLRFSLDTRVETRPLPGPKPSRGALLGGCVLLIGMLVLLYVHIGFASYALTGVFWANAEGVVTTPGTSSTPTVRFATPNGATHRFSEDYIQLCGGRGSFCWIRDFTKGEVVPVVYDPAVPRRAFIHDWVLTSNAATWFIEAGAEVLFALLMAVAVTRRPLRLQFRLGRGSGFPDRDS